MADTPPKKPKIVRQDLPPPRMVAFPGSKGPAIPPKVPPKVPVKPLVPKLTSDPAATTGAITGPFPFPRPAVAPAPATPTVAVPPIAKPPVAVPPVAVPPVAVPPVATAPAAPAAPPPAPRAETPSLEPAAASKPTASAKPVAAAKPVAPMKPVVPTPKRQVKAPVKPTAPSADPVIGKVLARCKIEERIGEGKTSVVYRATHTALGMPVAVKILHPSVLEHPEIVAQFENEARAIAKLDHANILKIFDVATEGDKHCIVMELLEGESVLDLLEDEGRVDPVDALRIVRQAAAGLAAAHGKQIIHRDVKPQNLVILADGTVKLVDFGLATAADDLAGSRIGTPHYMSPEVCQAKPASPESDVYSLGVTLYHLLVGSPPYAGMTIKEILESHIEGRPLHPERKLPGLGKPLCELVRDMTKRDPLTRMSTADVIAAVDQIGGKELAARPRLKARRARLARAAAQGRAPMVAIVGGAVLVAGLLVFLLTRGGSGPTAPEKPGTTTGQNPGGSDGTTNPTAPGTGTPENPKEPAGTTPETPVAPTPPPETEDQRKQREKKEAMQKKLLSEQDLKMVTDYARSHEEDKPGVILKYRQVATTWKGTDAGKEATRRANGIEKGEMPVHPDKTFAPPEKVDLAKQAWDAAKPKIEAAVLAMKYEEASKAVPEALADREGELHAEVLFWRQLLKDCAAFLESMRRNVDDLKGDERKIETPKGTGKLVKGTDFGVKVQIGDEVIDVAWAQLKPSVLAEMAQAAFAGKPSGLALNAQLAAFAFAHKVDEAFYGAVMAVKNSNESGPLVDQAGRALERADARFAPPDPKKPAPEPAMDEPAMEPAMDEPGMDEPAMEPGMDEPGMDPPDEK